MNCKELSTALVCYNLAGVQTTLVAHYEYGLNAAGATILVSTIYTDSAGVPVDTAAGTVTAGACALPSPDVEFEPLCDVQTNGTVIEFFRRTITSFDAAGLATSVPEDFAIDKVTPYVPTGTVGACNQDCDAATALGVLTAWG